MQFFFFSSTLTNPSLMNSLPFYGTDTLKLLSPFFFLMTDDFTHLF